MSRDQPLGERDRRLVSEPTEHHVRHLPELIGDRRVQDRMPVAVDRRPPGRHPVDDLARRRPASAAHPGPTAPAAAGEVAGIGAYGCQTVARVDRQQTLQSTPAGRDVTDCAFAVLGAPRAVQPPGVTCTTIRRPQSAQKRGGSRPQRARQSGCIAGRVTAARAESGSRCSRHGRFGRHGVTSIMTASERGRQRGDRHLAGPRASPGPWRPAGRASSGSCRR